MDIIVLMWRRGYRCRSCSLAAGGDPENDFRSDPFFRFRFSRLSVYLFMYVPIIIRKPSVRET